MGRVVPAVLCVSLTLLFEQLVECLRQTLSLPQASYFYCSSALQLSCLFFICAN